MRLGIRLAALLKGITFIGDVGHFLLRAGAYGVGRSHRRAASAAPRCPYSVSACWSSAGLAPCAGFIKAAISRQKEFLADASAVQFTRDNRGIANALKVIGGFLPGSLVHAARAAEMSHIFFGEVRHSACGRAFPRIRRWSGASCASTRSGMASSSSARSALWPRRAQRGTWHRPAVPRGAGRWPPPRVASPTTRLGNAPPGDADFADAAPADGAVDDAGYSARPRPQRGIHEPARRHGTGPGAAHRPGRGSRKRAGAGRARGCTRTGRTGASSYCRPWQARCRTALPAARTPPCRR
jgi:hypothetical protein